MISTQLGEPCVMPDSPKAEQYSETRLDWEDAERSLHVEAYMTAAELLSLVHELVGGTNG